MFKRIALTILIAAATAVLFGAYFLYTGKYVSEQRRGTLCKDVHITVLDSLKSGAVDKSEILDLVNGYAAGRVLDSINLHSIETMLDTKGEIEKSQVFITPDEILNVQITQRLPVVRFEKDGQHFYSDISGYLFPANHPIKIPVATGNIPIKVKEGYKGYADSASLARLRQITDLAAYVAKDNYWKDQIEQIDIEKNMDIVLYTANGDVKFIFGDASDKEEKFRKIEAYYRDIVPDAGDKKYKTVNLKYKNQIICK